MNSPLPDRLVGMLPPAVRHVLLLVATGMPSARTGLAARYPEMTTVLPRYGAAINSTRLLLRASLERLPLRSSAFELVVVDMAVAENHDLAQVLREVGRVLRPGGALGIAVDNRVRTLSALIHLLLPNGFDVPLIAQEMSITNVFTRRASADPSGRASC